jgi:hypothetical protein
MFDQIHQAVNPISGDCVEWREREADVSGTGGHSIWTIKTVQF